MRAERTATARVLSRSGLGIHGGTSSPGRHTRADVHSGAEKPSTSGRSGIAVALVPRIVAILQRFAARFRLRGLRRAVTKALLLAPRGFVPRDSLILKSISARLKLEWRSRDIHPWDRHLSPERRNELFQERTLVDTDAAIARCFHLLPEVEEIEVRVLAPHAPDTVVLGGTVARQDAAAVRAIASPRMRLELMGIRLLG